MRLQTKPLTIPAIYQATKADLDSIEHLEYAEKLFFYCHQLSDSVEGLKGSINRYEQYKENKKIRTLLLDAKDGK